MAKKKGGKRVGLALIATVLAVVLIALIGATIWAENTLNLINRVSGEDETLSDEQMQSILQETDPLDEEYTGILIEDDEVQLSTGPAEVIENDSNIINILLIGQDRREHQGRQRSDSMILCTINTEQKTLVMTSFMRDLYVEIPDWNGQSYLDNRLNVCYAFGGMGMLDECLKQNFGIVVDHNVEVDFSGFTGIIDSLGGVDIELTRAEASVVGGGAVAGMNHLNGEQALTYARIRKLDSDFGRTNRQRTVLLAVLEQVRNLSLTEINGILNGILPLITTDMDNSDITGYLMKIFPILKDLKVTTLRIPTDDTYYGARIREMAVLVPDLDAIRQILKDTLS